MKKYKPNLYSYLLILFFCFFSTSIFSQEDCGVERWDVKTLTDDDVDEVDFDNVVYSTVSQQANMPGVDVTATTPRLESEKTVYKIRCYMIEFDKQDDRDYHLVIKGERGTKTMVAEICDPDCPGLRESPMYDELVVVWDKFVNYVGGRKSGRKKRVHMQIEGVGFYDKDHARPPRGNAENNREIHPITKLTFLRN